VWNKGTGADRKCRSIWIANAIQYEKEEEKMKKMSVVRRLL
jgi:hypothetical protein